MVVKQAATFKARTSWGRGAVALYDHRVDVSDTRGNSEPLTLIGGWVCTVASRHAQPCSSAASSLAKILEIAQSS